MELLPFLRGGQGVLGDRRPYRRTRPERLRAWFGRVRNWASCRRRETLRRAWRRARALADGDVLLPRTTGRCSTTRWALTGDLGPLAFGTGGGDDLARYADDIAQVSLAAAPFVASFVRRIRDGGASGVRPRYRMWDRRLFEVVLDADPQVRVEGIDLAAEVITIARAGLDRDGYGSRAQLHVGDVRRGTEEVSTTFDLVMLLNNIYYFDPPPGSPSTATSGGS